MDCVLKMDAWLTNKACWPDSSRLLVGHLASWLVPYYHIASNAPSEAANVSESLPFSPTSSSGHQILGIIHYVDGGDIRKVHADEQKDLGSYFQVFLPFRHHHRSSSDFNPCFRNPQLAIFPSDHTKVVTFEPQSPRWTSRTAVANHQSRHTETPGQTRQDKTEPRQKKQLRSSGEKLREIAGQTLWARPDLHFERFAEAGICKRKSARRRPSTFQQTGDLASCRPTSHPHATVRTRYSIEARKSPTLKNPAHSSQGSPSLRGRRPRDWLFHRANRARVE